MKKLTALGVLFLLLASLYALPDVSSVFPFLDKESVEKLTESSAPGGSALTGSTLKDGILHLVPYSSLIYRRAEEASAEDNSFTVAVSSFSPYPAGWAELDEKGKMLAVLNILTGISGQKGITYISRTAGYKEKTLIEDSYCILDLANPKTEMPDPVFSSLPGSVILYSYQKDNRFGGNTFVLDYRIQENEIFLRITNHTDMKFFGVTCVKKEKLSMYVDAFLTEEGVVISCLASVYDRKPTFTVLFYKIDVEDSFQRRITGMKDWFIKKLQGADLEKQE